jgi:ribosomal protein S18 acetylase RimI-like enzyme
MAMPPTLRSLGYRSDLIFPKFDGEILDRGDYLAISTPSNPTFYWGNFLLFRDPPAEGDAERWKRLFAEEIGHRLRANHIAFGWDSPEGEEGASRAFLDEGFERIKSIVLTTDRVEAPPKYNRQVIVRPLTEDWEWEKATRAQVDCRGPGFGLEAYQVFKGDQMRRYRRMSRAGLGHWFGAFLGDELAADLGVFVDGDLARFQNVETRPEHRRLGICGALVHQACLYALARLGAKNLVMVADEEYHAAKIYESAGFKPRELQVGLQWSPRSAP